MQARIIDLSLPIQADSGEPVSVEINQIDHKNGGNIFGKKIAFRKQNSFLKRLKSVLFYFLGIQKTSKNSFPDGEFLNMEIIKASTHTGTHLDAPYHFGTLSEGKSALTVDQIPLEWCFNDGCVLDLTRKKAGEIISIEDMQQAISAIKYQIKTNDIVLIRTGACKYWGSAKYMHVHPGMSSEATLFLLNKGVKIIGIDAFGFDRPFISMLNDYFNTANKNVWFPAHFIGRKKTYCHIERLTNLDLLPPYGFKIACFPIKIKNSGAAWARVVAILN